MPLIGARKESGIVLDRRPAGLRPGVAALSALLLLGAAPAERKPLAFEITYEAGFRPGPISARVYVMLGPALGFGGEPRSGPNWFRSQPFFAVEARGWKAGEPLRVGTDAAGFPDPLGSLTPG